MRENILLIEENAEMRKNIGAFLRHEGYDVAETDDGAKAIEMIVHKLPSLIICEKAMHCMDGYDVFFALFKTIFYHKIPFIYFLGDAKLKTARVLSIENCQGERVLDGDLVQCVKKCMAVELPLMDSATVTAMPSVGAQWP